MKRFPHVTVSGDSYGRGLAYGRELRDRIRATYGFYANTVFPSSQCSLHEIRKRADRVRQIILAFEPQYATEIEAIAEGADMEAWQIYVLNARTEILNAPVAECTAMYFQRARVLGQTWDWIRELEDLAVVTTYEHKNGRRVVTFGEPGILAKIGLNDRGLGVCLNFLMAPHKLDGVPVHVLIRAILDAEDLEGARQVIKRSGYGKASHFLVGDDRGGCLSIEFTGDRSHEVESAGEVFVHTNHCIARGAEARCTPIPTTTERLQRARDSIEKLDRQSVDNMKTVLLDDGAGPGAITVRYRPEEVLGGLAVGSCATIVMDLPRRIMHIKKGPDAGRSFTRIAVL